MNALKYNFHISSCNRPYCNRVRCNWRVAKRRTFHLPYVTRVSYMNSWHSVNIQRRSCDVIGAKVLWKILLSFSHNKTQNCSCAKENICFVLKYFGVAICWRIKEKRTGKIGIAVQCLLYFKFQSIFIWNSNEADSCTKGEWWYLHWLFWDEYRNKGSVNGWKIFW